MPTIDFQSVFADGVCVTKRLRRESGHRYVTYDVESQRNEPVTVTLVDEVPGGDPTAIEFRRGRDLGDWTVRGTRLVFERELAPSGHCETLYRLCDVPGTVAEDEFSKPVVQTESTLIEDPVLDLQDPRAQATDGGPTRDGSERE